MSRFGKISWGLGAWGKAAGEGQAGPNIGIKDLQAVIHGFFDDELSASIRPHHLRSLAATLNPVPSEDMGAVLQPIPGKDLPAETVPVPGVNLGAIGGGHFPEDIEALLNPVVPVNLSAYIRRGFKGTDDIGASLTQVGAFKDMSALLRSALRQTNDLSTTLRVIAKTTKDLGARLQPIHQLDLSASIITERVFDQTAIIWGYARELVKDLSAIIRRVDSDTLDLPVSPLKARVSTHTSGKLPNLTKVAKKFFDNRYVFGTADAGMFILTLEPIFGVFPDLAAEIFAQEFFRDNIRGFLRAAIRDSKDLGTVFTSVVPFINVNKILLELVPLLNLPGDLVQVGAFKRTRGSITPVHKSSTGTSPTAGFITTASSFRFLIGTTKGLFIPPQVVPQVRITTYRNDFPRPDLHATIAGWYEADIGASISDYPFKPLPASLNALDASHISSLSARIAPFRTEDIGGQLTPSGGFEGLGGDVVVAGAISDLSASLVPRINPLSFNVVSVSTMPISDMGAIINYGTLVRCAPTSQVIGLGAYVKSIVTGTDETVQNLSATLNVLRLQNDLPGEVVGRKRTRIRVLSLTFRSKTRDSEGIRGSVTPVIPTHLGLSAQITGLLHEADLPATITPFRYEPHDVEFTTTEKVVNFADSAEKNILLSFRSLVSSYVFEDVSNAVYATDRDTWAIDLRTLIRDESFFDRSPNNRVVTVDGLQEFNTLDEAIRNAIVILTERLKENIGASITARGVIRDLGVELTIRGSDKIAALSSSLVSVANAPDIAASINDPQTEFSAFLQSRGSITPLVSSTNFLFGEIVGSIIDDLGAEITAST